MKNVFERNASATPLPMPDNLETGHVQVSNSPTVLGPYWYQMVTQELVNILLLNNVVPSAASLNQIGTLIKLIKDGLTDAQDDIAYLDSIAPIGTVIAWPGDAPPPKFIKANGALLPRSGPGSFPKLTDLVVNNNGGTVTKTTEANWASTYPGRFSLGDEATTIRVPDYRSMILKGHHDGSNTRTTNVARAQGTYEGDQILAHTHPGITLLGYGGAGEVEEARGAPDWSLLRYIQSAGGPENLVRNMSILWCLRAL